jgi:hypothetical protein
MTKPPDLSLLLATSNSRGRLLIALKASVATLTFRSVGLIPWAAASAECEAHSDRLRVSLPNTHSGDFACHIKLLAGSSDVVSSFLC